ncbi:dihydrodipicolinate synthase family protein [Acidovorax sp. SUPP3334]|uniref:dihydrodipicolinate synthase family protein n=1 Tax=Acidovorax sp. SUPP3334 TaxID=2920881 RepID=UPI0023DE3CBB|nr:dihydrodipicolinate synthase family protein [Acidovorax sp. SUPP3334]GKT24340.1 hypothetical protein AVHM3334_14460 [Acidovorax sp. SUPP3334]
MPAIANYRGIIPAISCPFTPDHRIDEPALRKLASWLAGHEGVVAIMTNGHTGEVFSLTLAERAEVTRIVADELKGRTPVISSIVCEGLAEAAEHARAAQAAGAVALDVMPPHHWLRFGFTPGHALQYFEAIHKAAPGLDLVCHVYPAWTRASYSSQLLAELAKLPYLQAFKVGQRDMNKYARDIQAIREADPSKAIHTCHDEYLLASMVQGVDATLVDGTGENLDPHKVWARMMINEKPGGHGERSVAVGTIDMAVWDAVAKIAGQPLYQLLAERYGNGTPDPRVFVYAAGGYYYPGKGVEGLQREMTSYLARGYSVVKMKIGGASLADDCERIESVLKILGPGQQLAVDANGRFDLQTAIDYGRALSQYPLFWYEEAGDPLDYELQARLGEVYKGPMATGENLFSMQDARNLIRHGGMLKDHGWSPSRCIPHGGHQMPLAIAAGLGLGGNESYPDLFQPYGGFPDGVKVENGYVTLPPLPGIGFEGKSDLIAEMHALAS